MKRVREVLVANLGSFSGAILLAVCTSVALAARQGASELFYEGVRHYERGTSTGLQGDFFQAIQLWRKAQSMLGKEPEPQLQAVVSYHLAMALEIVEGEFQEIVQNFETAIAVAELSEPSELLENALFNLARALSVREDFATAQQYARRLVALRPSDGDAVNLLATCLEQAPNQVTDASTSGRVAKDGPSEAFILRRVFIEQYARESAPWWYELGRAQMLYASSYDSGLQGRIEAAFRRSQELSSAQWSDRQRARGRCRNPTLVHFHAWENHELVGHVVQTQTGWAPESEKNKTTVHPDSFQYGWESPSMLQRHADSSTWASQLYEDRPIRIAELHDVALTGDSGVIIDHFCRVFLLSDDFHVPLHLNLGSDVVSQSNVPTIKKATSTITLLASTFYHFFCIALPRVAVLRDALFEDPRIKIIVPTCPDNTLGAMVQCAFAAPLLAQLGLASERLVPYTMDQITAFAHGTNAGIRFKVDRLLVADWKLPLSGSNSESPTADTRNVAARQALLELHRQLIADEDKTRANRRKRRTIVFIARRTSRRIIHEQQLLKTLKDGVSKGWRVKTFAEDKALSVDKVRKLFSEASVIVGVHGAGLSNILYCQPQTVVIELTLPQPHAMYYSHLAAAINLSYWSLPFKDTHLLSAKTVPHVDLAALSEITRTVMAQFDASVP
eukprot:TRINITY_DN50166_c0_g1_i1.p1 TRINITY_DN50166_c0_g1~~TRINITY_DN50166_c0_g1_i1.p1  ORF type:complete len:674 (-),score=65.48 TRINITY_DN50166_c0_g1_i1:141-2162(-)